MKRKWIEQTDELRYRQVIENYTYTIESDNKDSDSRRQNMLLTGMVSGLQLKAATMTR